MLRPLVVELGKDGQESRLLEATCELEDLRC